MSGADIGNRRAQFAHGRNGWRVHGELVDGTPFGRNHSIAKPRFAGCSDDDRQFD
jgi:hypothetical protein